MNSGGRFLVPVLVLGIAIAGCGGGGSSESNSTSRRQQQPKPDHQDIATAIRLANGPNGYQAVARYGIQHGLTVDEAKIEARAMNLVFGRAGFVESFAYGREHGLSAEEAAKLEVNGARNRIQSLHSRGHTEEAKWLAEAFVIGMKPALEEAHLFGSAREQINEALRG